MRFQFRLEKGLHFLRIRETTKKMEIVSVQKRIQLLESKHTRLESTMREMLTQQTTHWSAAMTFYHTRKIALDAKELREVEERIMAERAHLQKKKDELNQLMLRRKGLESLKEKKQAEFRVLENRRQQHRLEDIHSARKGVGIRSRD